MNRTLLPLLVATLVAATSCRHTPGVQDASFSPIESRIITQSDSVMYVTQLHDATDSIILRTPSVDLTERQLRSPLLATLMAKMLATVTSPQQDGVGIAAPQVGLDVRLVAVQRYDKADRPFEFFANIHIAGYAGDTVRGPEGCLSVPPLRGYVPRRDTVVVRYVDPLTLADHTDTIGGYTAIIFQHEIDHLDARLYIDRADTVFVNERWIEERRPYEAAGDYSKPLHLFDTQAD